MTENAFDNLHHDMPDEIERQIIAENQQFESERLKWLLDRLKLGAYARNLRKIWEDHAGVPELKFSAFNDLFPTFPFLLGSSRLRGIEIRVRGSDGKMERTSAYYHVHADNYSTEPSRFKNFRNVPFVCAYENFFNSVAGAAEARKIALVYPRKGFLHGMVIHNDDTEQYWTGGLCWVYKDKGTGNKLYIQPFANLVEGIYVGGRGWKPD